MQTTGFALKGESEGEPSEVLTGMIHVHPHRKNKENTHRNSHDHDYYSLGMVLTEIGLWKQLYHLEPESAFVGESTAAPDRCGNCGLFW